MRGPLTLLILILLLISSAFTAHAGTGPACEPPQVIFNKDAENIFSIEQEEFLGEAVNARVRKNYRVIDDTQLTAYLDKIGERIAKHLPDSRVKFKFHIADLPEANAFITAGGYVYVTRKLIAFVKSEDELAGVIAHEMGHGIVRHGTIDYTKLFKKILNVKSLGDRRDVFNKYNEYLDNLYTKRVTFKRNHIGKKQLEADEIGLFGMIAAGYDGKALLEFWDRFTELEGKAGNWFTDFVGDTSSAQKRYRSLLENFKVIPPECKDRSVASTDQFEKWRRVVVNYTGLGQRESLSAVVARKKLSPPLQPEINHLKFSPDGRYIIAQDDGGVNVLSSKPFEFLFRIDAPESKPASFTQDSKRVVLYNAGLRVQKWNIAERSAESITESYIRIPCWQTELSPDGNLMACFNRRYELTVYEVATNKLIFKKERMYVPSRGEYFFWIIALSFVEAEELNLFTMKFTPDSKMLIAGRRFDRDSKISVGYDKSNSIGVDLEKAKAFKLNKNLKKLVYGAFTFISNDTIVGTYGQEQEKSGVFSFPSGERKEQFYLNGLRFSKPGKGDYLMVRPVTNAPVGVYDLKQKKFILANRTDAMDVYGDLFVSERKTGELGLYLVEGGSLKFRKELPISTFGILRSAMVSDDGKWLAASERARGGVWSTSSGERIFFIRGFRDGFFDESGQMYTDFPKNKSMERMIGVMNGDKRQVAQGLKIDDNTSRLRGRYLVSFVPKKEKKKESQIENEKEREEAGDLINFGAKNGTLVVRNAVNGIELWSREFKHDRPGFRYSREHDSLVFSFFLESKTAKEIIDNDPALKAKRAKLEDRDGDYLIQVLEPDTGVIKSQSLLETGEGSFRIQGVYAAGDWLVIDDTRSRILLYSISGDAIRHRFFGYSSTISTENNVIVIENEPGRLTVYDTNSGESIDSLRFTSRVAYMRFLGGQNELFVLTEDQEVFRFDAKLFGKSKERIAIINE